MKRNIAVFAALVVFLFASSSVFAQSGQCDHLVGAAKTACEKAYGNEEVGTEPTATPPTAGVEEAPTEGEPVEGVDGETNQITVVEDVVILNLLGATTNSLRLRWTNDTENPLEGYLGDAVVQCEDDTQPRLVEFDRPLMRFGTKGEFEIDGLPSDEKCWVGVGVYSEDGSTEYQGAAIFKTQLPTVQELRFPRFWILALIGGILYHVGVGFMQPPASPARPTGTSSRP